MYDKTHYNKKKKIKTKKKIYKKIKINKKKLTLNL